MQKIGVIPNIVKDDQLEMTKKAIDWFEVHQFQVAVTPSISEMLNRKEIGLEEDILYKTSDCIVVLGGRNL